jgi:hypothetical protein
MVEKLARYEKAEPVQIRARTPLSEGLISARRSGFVNLVWLIPVRMYAECR